MNDYGLLRDRRRRPYPLGHPNRALGLSATCLLVACGGGDGGMMTRSARARRAIASRMRGINTRQDSPSIGASVRAISEGHAEAFSSRCGNELQNRLLKFSIGNRSPRAAHLFSAESMESTYWLCVDIDDILPRESLSNAFPSTALR